MAFANNGAQWAPDHPAFLWLPDMEQSDISPESAARLIAPRPGRLRRSIPRPVPMLVAAFLVALLLPMALPATRAEAATCGTNWSSYKEPPQTIRVLLTNRPVEKVIVVPFRKYVAMVMASGEFPTWLPPAVLQAGATAVKQYGWYYAMKGHHRATYRTASGVCYDVRNDTNDQLYRTVAHPTAKQQKAIDATWGLTLRKGKSFFLTGYRAGVASKCGADADGWRLYAKSMVDCADQGWDRQRIQLRYYAPKVSFVWHSTKPPPHGDSTPPTLSVPEVTPSGTQSDAAHLRVTISWSGTDDQSGVASYGLQERVNGGAWHKLPLPSSKSTSVSLDTRPGDTYQFRVKASDTAKNRTAWVNGVAFEPQLAGSSKAKLRGTWTARESGRAIGGSILTTMEKGATATFTFHGSGIGVIASRGRFMGKLRIRIDGAVVDVIDLRSRSGQNRRVVFSQSWAKSGNHTITVESLGTAGRPRINVDAFVLLH